MSYYWVNRHELLQKGKEKYSKEKAAEYYLKNKEAINKSQRIDTKTYQKKKRQDWRVPKKKISATDSVQKRSIAK